MIARGETTETRGGKAIVCRCPPPLQRLTNIHTTHSRHDDTITSTQNGRSPRARVRILHTLSSPLRPHRSNQHSRVAASQRLRPCLPVRPPLTRCSPHQIVSLSL